jgi:hypothetical protein
MAQKAIGRLFGMGEYKESLAGELGVDHQAIVESNAPEVNSLVAPLSSNELVPIMHHDAEGTIRISRREFIGTIVIRDEPQTYTYDIAPGSASSVNVVFPWLTPLAKNFQQYSFLGFAAEYVPTSGVAVSSTSAALGQVAMAFKYDVNEEQFGQGNSADWPLNSLQGLLNMNGSMSCSPAAPGTCYMECDPRMSNQPVRYVETGEDLNPYYSEQNYKAAKLLIRTEGAQSLTVFQAGQLWFTYEIVLFNPRPQNTTPPIVDKYSELVAELQALLTFNGPMSDAEAVRISARIMRLRAFIASLEFASVRAESMQTAKLKALTAQKEEPEISKQVQKYLDDERKFEKPILSRTIRVPPGSPASEVFTLEDEDMIPPGSHSMLSRAISRSPRV